MYSQENEIRSPTTLYPKQGYSTEYKITIPFDKYVEEFDKLNHLKPVTYIFGGCK